MWADQAKNTFPLHWAVWHDEREEIRRLVQLLGGSFSGRCKSKMLEQLDTRGRTPLMLSVALKRTECVEILLELGADATALSKEFWSVTDEAVCSKDADLLQMCLMYRDFQRSINLSRLATDILEKLSRTTDFYVELTWEFNSWVPFVSKMCPSDAYKVYKRGSNLRLDATLVGFENGEWKRGRQSYIFKTTGSDEVVKFFIIDLESRTVFSEHLADRNGEIDRSTEIELQNYMPTRDTVDFLLRSPVSTLYVDLESVAFERKAGGLFGLGFEKTELVNGYDCKVFSIVNVNLITKTRTEHLDEEAKKAYREANTKGSILDSVLNWLQGSETKIAGTISRDEVTPEEYFFPNTVDRWKRDVGPSKELSIRKRSFNANLCLSDDYPLSLIEQIVPIVDIMASTNAHFARLKDFLTLHFPSGFPIKIEIPIFHVLNAVVTFENVHAEQKKVDGVTFLSDPKYKCCALDDNLFDVPLGYSSRDIGAEQYSWAKNEEYALLQYAIRQSLCAEQRDVQLNFNQEDIAYQRAISESMQTYFCPSSDTDTNLNVVQGQQIVPSNANMVSINNNNGIQDLDLDENLTLAMAISEQEEAARRRALESEELELKRILELSLSDKDGCWTCENCTLSNKTNQNFCSTCNQKREACPTMKPEHKVDFSTNIPCSESLALQRQTSELMDLIRLVEESEASEQFQQIVAYCKVNGQSFVDDSFPPSDLSIGALTLNTPGHTLDGSYQDFCHRHIFPVIWRRPFQIVDDYTNNNPFSNCFYWSVYSNPKPTDIIQGFLGNCWFLSALAVLAERRDLLEHAIITKVLNMEGAYQIRLCIDGRWKAKRRQLWVRLIEKALAKLHGSYAALSTGRTVEGLAVLTGAPCVTLSLEFDEQFSDQPPDLNLLWAKLLSAKEAGFIMGTSCGAGSRQVNDQEYAQMGLHPRHAYSLLDFRDIHGLRLIQLRNPWGRGEWTGAWSNGFELWKDQAIAEGLIGITHTREDKNAQGGLFWMPFEEFCRYYDSVDICKLRPNCKEVRIQVPLSSDCSPKNVFCVYFHIDETTEVDLALYQSVARNEKMHKDGFVDLCIMLFNSDIYGNMGSLKVSSDRLIKPFVVINALLSRGTYMVMCLSFSHWHTTVGVKSAKQAVLAAHSPSVLNAQICPVPSHLMASHQFLLKRGEPYTEIDDVMIYYSCSKSWSGMAIMVENSCTTLSLVVTCTCTDSENIISSRASLTTYDVVLPRRRQYLESKKSDAET